MATNESSRDDPGTPLRVAESRQRLHDAADEALERSTREHLSLERTVERLMKILAEHSGASATWLHTYDESAALRDFAWPADSLESFEGALAVTSRRIPFVERESGRTILGQHIDVAGELFGSAALLVERDVSGDEQEELCGLLRVWCEELDNYLAAIARARTKHRITSELSDALKDPLLDRGILKAIEVLKVNIDFDDMLLAYRHENEVAGTTLGYKILKDGQLAHDSSVEPRDPDVDGFLRAHALWLEDGKDRDVPTRFGFTHYREEVLISGIREETLVGRLIVTTQRGDFNTFDRDLLERFADYLRQRIVDFNREWKSLSRVFARRVAARLLAEEEYRKRYLTPREREVAVLFCDISGFTRLSEQVLQEPEEIGRLIDTWGDRVVNILWETGGVFDKMVGDCIIGLWGPPFFESTAKDACRRAVDAAVQIRDYTQSLNHDTGWPKLRGLDPPLGVATGLNYCPLFVGLFGPDENYTGFSSGMNNTARLQGVAGPDEILCMNRFVESFAEPERFGQERQAEVKNVRDPLRFRAILG